MDWIKKHFTLVGILVIIVVGGVWYGMANGGGDEESLLTTNVVNGSGSPSEDVADRELIETLLTLRSITLSGTIFSDPAFKVLKDFGTTIVPEPVGRPNPFAPRSTQGTPPQPQTTGTPAGARR